MNFLETLFNNKINTNTFFVLAGPCVVEGEEITIQIAKELDIICKRLQIPLIFKASYKKANRSSANSFTGIGNEAALQILQKIKNTLQMPIVTDVHTAEEAIIAANYVDVLQIPAFLCRQTDLLEAAANTGKIVNIKKGQFLNGESMQHAIKKITNLGNEKVMLTERGNSFGYQDMVVDFRNIPIMQAYGKPVIMDCTHALQQPNQPSGVTGGQPQYIETIAKCAIAAGADGLFIETHPDPKNAKSDGANMLPLAQFEGLMRKLLKIKKCL